MPKIVISYRRSDSKEITGHIYDRLCRRFGKRSVFMDIDNIPAGVDFRAHVDKALQNADVLLAVVGPGWLNVQPSGQTTLHNDWVGVEVGTGLKTKDLRIIPVLVRGAQMPAPEALPPPLRNFVYLNAVKVDSGQDFDLYMGRLIRAIDNRPAWMGWAIAACVAVLLIGASAAVWQFMPRSEPTTPAPGSSNDLLKSSPPAVPPAESAVTQVPITPPAAAPSATATSQSPPDAAPSGAPAVPPAAAARTAPAAPVVVDAPAAVQPSQPSAPAKEVASLPKQPPVVAHPDALVSATTRTVTAIEGEAFMLCGQPDFTVSMWQPRPNAATEVSLRRHGMMLAGGLSLQLARGKPRSIADDCEVTFVEIKSGFKPIAVLEERRKRN